VFGCLVVRVFCVVFVLRCVFVCVWVGGCLGWWVVCFCWVGGEFGCVCVAVVLVGWLRKHGHYIYTS
jgi:hypothetical protein